MGKRGQEREQGNKQGEGGGQVKSRGSEKMFFYEIRGLWGGGSLTSLRLSYLLDYAS